MLGGAGTVQSPPPTRKEQTGKLTEAALLQFTFRSNTVAMSSALWKRGADSLAGMCRELGLCLENPSVICSVADDPCPSPEAASQGQKTGAGCHAVPLMATSRSHSTTTSESRKPFQAPNTDQASFKSVFTGSQQLVVADTQEASSDCRKRRLGPACRQTAVSA